MRKTNFSLNRKVVLVISNVSAASIVSSVGVVNVCCVNKIYNIKKICLLVLNVSSFSTSLETYRGHGWIL